MIWSEGSLGIISKSVVGSRPLIPLLGTAFDDVSYVSVALDVSASLELSRLLMIESNYCHSWSNLGSIWVSTFTSLLPCSCCLFYSFSHILSCSFLCTSSCYFLYASSCSTFWSSFCSLFWNSSKISDVAGGSLVSCYSGSLDCVIGAVANKSRGRVCNLYSLGLLNSTKRHRDISF